MANSGTQGSSRAVLLVAATIASALGAGAQEPVSAPSGAGTYTGVVSCASTGCHGSPAPVANANVLMNEYDSWLHAPAPTHVKAYEVLANRESARIAKNLRLGKPAWQAKVCLDCHATNVPKELQANTIELSDGVQCESCHGPAGGWRAQHVEEGWTHADSVKAGMIDLRDVGVRARNCLGCHMGDATKTVDHDLIAAGHPILTFELDNFTESRLMPPHWKKPSEKRDPASYGPETHGMKAWAVGQVVTFEEGLLHLARQARSDAWPDFSVMSCAACHHDLRSGEWRQTRGYEGRPGMPPWSTARWAVLRHLVATFAPGEAAGLDGEVRKLASLVASMNRPQQLAETAEGIAKRLAAVERRVSEVDWSEKNVRAMMRAIAADREHYLRTERQSAEQATFALLSLSAELVRSNPRLVRSSTVAAVDELYRTIDRSRFPDEYDREAFAAALGKLEESLR
jgi:hypothetical protein